MEVHVLVDSWELFFLIGFSGAIFISFLFYAASQRERMRLQQKESEQEITQYYMSQLEQQQSAVRQFKHDWQNVLLSIEEYLATNNAAGLKHYFYSQIKTTTEVITKDNFMLDRLANIKIPEIKTTLAGKLMLAQSTEIDVSFEASDEISHIPVSSLAVVRMLSIILDNALEELAMLTTGRLAVTCYNVGNGVTFVVKNTCRAATPKIHELTQPGFSTKGNGRGLGLSNLTEITNTYPDNITLQTSIKDGHFIQKVRIGAG